MSQLLRDVNKVFENFYKLFYESEDLALKRGIKCLTHTELHIIEAIGREAITMNELAERLAITMGTATVAITKLGDKGFVLRTRSDSDRRKVYVSLSEKGREALNYHNNYHKMILSNITENIDEKDLTHFLDTFERILENLRTKSEFLKPLMITDFDVKDKVSIVEIKGTPIVQDYFRNHGIEHYTVVEIVKTKEMDKIALKKADGNILEVNILDAKNLIALKVEN